MYIPGLPSVTRDLAAPASTGQLTVTGCMVGLALGQLVAGPVSDAHGRRRPLLIGLVGYVVASLLCAISPSIAVLVAMRLVQGLCGGVGIVISRAIVRDLADGETAARIFSLLMAITGVAPVFAPLIGGQILLFTDWRGVFVVLAVIGVPVLAGSAIWLPETLPSSARHTGGLPATLRTFGLLLRDRQFVPYLTAFSLSFSAMFAYISGSSFVLENIYGISPQLFSVLFAINSAGLIALSQVSARLVGRVSPAQLIRRGLIGVGVASAGAFVVTITSAGLVPLLVCFFVLLSANGLVLPNGMAAAMSQQEGMLGAASALLGLGQFGGGAAVAPLVGVAGGHDATPMAVVIAACGVTALFVDLAFAPRRARAPAGAG